MQIKSPPDRITLRIPADRIQDRTDLARRLALALGLEAGSDPPPFHVLRRSIDARSSPPCYELVVGLGASDPAAPSFLPPPLAAPRRHGPPVVIVGAGPAGYFAALELLAQGVRPVVLERGLDVKARRYDIARLHREGRVAPDSNYCFGEGGAGAYSDGKLYTRSTKRGDVGRVLACLVAHGAHPDILVDAHPHIGSNRLPRIVTRLRRTILEAGGDVHFGRQVVDLVCRRDRVRAVVTADGREWPAAAVILAAGHSARDVYTMLGRHGARLEAKPFALGVRLEHPQALIDRIQYRLAARPPQLPPATYRLAAQIAGRGVFSFCMCPGGHVIPASTAPGELVINGMSMAGRGAPLANAGLVVEIRLADIPGLRADDPLAALHFQEAVERAVFSAAGGGLRAPAQRMTDFVAGRLSASLPPSSYRPGCVAAPVHALLPEGVARRLQAAFTLFGQRCKGFLTASALVLAVESRTSAPVRIVRDPATLMAPGLDGLYPCGEGAGYAGGIVSAAIDGQNVARRVAQIVKSLPAGRSKA
jgi:uncharacterized FAD-dependent dehydrogenase